jgi:segregation and condensation protein A
VPVFVPYIVVFNGQPVESTQENTKTFEGAVAGTFFEVRLDSFDGPIDLLLHLVKGNELSIERISLAAVTSQYLECIEKMRDLDLDIASEYLLVAATLLSIKAAVLLQDPIELQNEPEENLPDPHKELLERLRAAQVYKNGAMELGKISMLGIDVFQRPSTLSAFESPEEVYRKHDSMLLGQAFRKLLTRIGKEGFLLKFEVDSVTVVERMVRIVDTLKSANGPIEFASLFQDAKNRMSIVNSFVAILELCRRCAIVVLQQNSYEEIKIALSGTDIDKSNLTSEFDVQGAEAAVKEMTVNG